MQEGRTYNQELWALVMDWVSNYLTDEQVRGGGSSPTYATGEPAFQAFWRTLAADCKSYSTTQRLDSSDVEHDDSLFRKVRDDESVLEMLNQLKCWGVLLKTTLKWRLATAHTGFYALIPLDAAEEDQLVALHCAKVPLLLRHVEGQDDTLFRVIGGAYVHGFMDGEARSWAETGQLEVQNLYLA
jgi:hypothetical protein